MNCVNEVAGDAGSRLNGDIGIELVEFGFCLRMVDNAVGHALLGFRRVIPALFKAGAHCLGRDAEARLVH